jgi:hypothetical protein
MWKEVVTAYFYSTLQESACKEEKHKKKLKQPVYRPRLKQDARQNLKAV